MDRMGSDLAHRPSENAPTNCDSSESERSNDSPSIRGVWKSGSNCERNKSAGRFLVYRTWVGRGFKQDPGLGLEEDKTCGQPEPVKG
jgi:hypothetical protein